ncbi:MAG: putative Ig domain-containing protein [Candidatus Omnitrophica bacterium]|nr:putative Ig domain-containing protein [Candidatus Omnitrophota bacterium]
MLPISTSWRKTTKNFFLSLTLLFSCIQPTYGSWETLQIPTENSEYIYDLQFISPTEGWALLTDAREPRLMHTTNGGEDWAEAGEWNPEIDIYEYANFQFLSPTEAWFVPWRDDLLLHTANGGVTIEEASSPFADDVYAAYFLDSETGWLAGEAYYATGSIAKTVDGGTTWAIQRTPWIFGFHDLFFLDQDRGWAAGSGIGRTEDGGESWSIARMECNGNPTAIRFFDEDHGWAVGNGGLIIHSIDGGRYWYRQESGTETDLLDVEVFSEREAMAVGYDGWTEGIVLSTSNGGATWKRENLPVEVRIRAIASSGDTIWVGGGVADRRDPKFVYLFRRTYNAEEFPAIIVEDLLGGTLGIDYEYGFRALGGAPPYTWEIVGDGPPGLLLEGDTGLLAGTPAQAGEHEFRVRLTDSSNNMDERDLVVHIASEPLSLQTSDLPRVLHRRTFREALDFRGGYPPYHWSFAGDHLPGGLGVDPKGVLNGTPFEVGSFDFTIRVTDSGSLPQAASASFHLDVDPLLEGTWESQHAYNRTPDIHFFDENHGLACSWSGQLLETFDGGRLWERRDFGEPLGFFDWIGDEGWLITSTRLLHTTDRGANWEELTHPGITAAGILFQDSQHGLIYYTGIRYTEDGGQTWNVASKPGGHYYWTMDFLDSQTGFAGGGDRSFAKTTDGGKSWTAASLPGLKEGKSLDPRVSGSRHPLITSSHEKDNDPKIPDVNGIFFLDDQEGWISTQVGGPGITKTIYHTTDRGETWEKQYFGGLGNLERLQFRPDGKRGWGAGLFSGSIRGTTDGGEHWESIAYFDKESGGGEHIFDLFFLDDKIGWALVNLEGRISENPPGGFSTYSIVDTEGSIWKTTDGGYTWFQQYGWPQSPDVVTNGVRQSTPVLPFGPDLVDISFPDAEHGFAIGLPTWGLHFILYATTSGGAEWEVRYDSLSDDGSINPFVRQMQFLSQWHGFGMGAVDSKTLYETVDGGRSWYPRYDIGDEGTLSATGATNSKVAPNLVGVRRSLYFSDDQYGWIVRDAGGYPNPDRMILKTTDAGDTWERIYSDGVSGYNNLFFLDRDHGWLYTNKGRIDNTTDGGETWNLNLQLLGADDAIFSVYFVNEYSGWAACGGGRILSTTDAGETWNEDIRDASWEMGDVYFATCLKGWAVGQDQILSWVGDPVILETNDAVFSPSDRLPLEISRHELTVIDSPDSVNVWALGGIGAGLKYSAPSDALYITTPTVPGGRVGQAYSFQLENQSGTPAFSWRICGGALPPGLALSDSGEIHGTPTDAATFRFVAAVFDSMGESAGKKFSIAIEPEASPIILTDQLPEGQVGEDYAAVLEATGTIDPYEWTLASGELPPGLIVLGYGVIGGTPMTPGLYPIEVRVRDGQVPYGTAIKELSIKINGRFAQQTIGPCDEMPLFCLALYWKQAPPVPRSDYDSDGDCDAFDCLRAIAQGR